PPWIPVTRTVDDWQTSAWDHFAQWSPDKIEEITHIVVAHHKKVPYTRTDQHTHSHDAEEKHQQEARPREVS
ncbi:MAG TPA: hypothetical protein VGU68_06750, partial [Ktedonobacteraceae bacterium]|nr:hypothetical protein [Ktedonobacteraceae bacterium]